MNSLRSLASGTNKEKSAGAGNCYCSSDTLTALSENIQIASSGQTCCALNSGQVDNLITDSLTAANNGTSAQIQQLEVLLEGSASFLNPEGEDYEDGTTCEDQATMRR